MTRRKRQNVTSARTKARQPPDSAEDNRHRSSDGPSAVAPAVPRISGKEWLFAAALVAAVFLAYQPAWQGGFIWDDDAARDQARVALVARSVPHLVRPGGHAAILSSACTAPSGSSTGFGAMRTLGYHLVNILLHCLAALMVALMLRRLAIPGAFLAAAIFALHPVQVESVAWITEQKNTLSAVFYLGAALAYLRFDEERHRSVVLVGVGTVRAGLVEQDRDGHPARRRCW